MNQAMKRKPQIMKNEWESINNPIANSTLANNKNEHDIESDACNVFQYSHGLTTMEANNLLEIFGKNELPEKVIPKWYIFLSLFWEPMPIMIWIAIIIEAILWKWMDMSILLAIQICNASIAFYETTKSG